MRWLCLRLLGIAFFAAVAGCGADGTANPPTCAGMTCACMAGTSCQFTVSTCGDSCSLACNERNVCDGTCGQSCSIQCSGGSSCSVTLGTSGSISCGKDSTCQVTCQGGCSLSCSDGAQCRLRCSGEAGFRDVPSGGRC